MDYSVFYYTYSTVAQTLAGAFGLITAVAIFRMSFLVNAMGTTWIRWPGSNGTTSCSTASNLANTTRANWML